MLNIFPCAQPLFIIPISAIICSLCPLHCPSAAGHESYSSGACVCLEHFEVERERGGLGDRVSGKLVSVNRDRLLNPFSFTLCWCLIRGRFWSSAGSIQQGWLLLPLPLLFHACSQFSYPLLQIKLCKKSFVKCKELLNRRYILALGPLQHHFFHSFSAAK